MRKNAKSKSRGEDEEVPVHQEGETGSEESTEENANVPQGSRENGVLKSEKEVLLDLYKTLKDLGINSIGDLEVKISRL